MSNIFKNCVDDDVDALKTSFDQEIGTRMEKIIQQTELDQANELRQKFKEPEEE
jgi:hypothetical protein